MSKDPEEPDYRVYRGGSGSTHAGRAKRPVANPDAAGSAGERGSDAGGGPADLGYGGTGEPPRGSRRSSRTPPARSGSGGASDANRDYNVYRSQPRGLGARLRGETDSDVGRRVEDAERAGATRREARLARGGRNGRLVGTRDVPRRGLGRWGRGTWSVRRAIKYVVCAVILWVLLSGVLFVISASEKAGNLPSGLAASLTKHASPMLLSAQNVLVLGLDNRPTTGYSSKEGGANHSEVDANTDSIMIWRVGGGVSRKLSIPRDTLVDIPGLGEAKINAAWSQSPALTVKVVEQLTGVTINHVIVVDLGNFEKFIDDIGGVTVTTPRICSSISGGSADGGYTLDLSAGSHHLTGEQALTLARTRDNSCNLAYTDIQREEMQQEIMNGIKSQLFSVHAFMHLPWASWDAPGVIQTDMGAATLLQLFASSEIGGSPKPETLTETNSTYGGEDVLLPNAAEIKTKVNQLLNG